MIGCFFMAKGGHTMHPSTSSAHKQVSFKWSELNAESFTTDFMALEFNFLRRVYANFQQQTQRQQRVSIPCLAIIVLSLLLMWLSSSAGAYSTWRRHKHQYPPKRNEVPQTINVTFSIQSSFIFSLSLGCFRVQNIYCDIYTHTHTLALFLSSCRHTRSRSQSQFYVKCSALSSDRTLQLMPS